MPFRLFAMGDGRRVELVLTGEHNGLPLRLFDYWYYDETTDSHGNRTKSYHRFTCGVLTFPASCPHLRLGHEGFFSRSGSHMGMHDVQFESDEFNKQFRVKCDDQKFAFCLRRRSDDGVARERRRLRERRDQRLVRLAGGVEAGPEPSGRTSAPGSTRSTTTSRRSCTPSTRPPRPLTGSRRQGPARRCRWNCVLHGLRQRALPRGVVRALLRLLRARGGVPDQAFTCRGAAGEGCRRVSGERPGARGAVHSWGPAEPNRPRFAAPGGLPAGVPRVVNAFVQGPALRDDEIFGGEVNDASERRWSRRSTT